uniref:Uncharacterized protein n=1 Tax=Rhizophora mucronata TaxID=61149 RepID=A0A2P2R1S4_RHIMU
MFCTKLLSLQLPQCK